VLAIKAHLFYVICSQVSVQGYAYTRPDTYSAALEQSQTDAARDTRRTHHYSLSWTIWPGSALKHGRFFSDSITQERANQVSV